MQECYIPSSLDSYRCRIAALRYLLDGFHIELFCISLAAHHPSSLIKTIQMSAKLGMYRLRLNVEIPHGWQLTAELCENHCYLKTIARRNASVGNCSDSRAKKEKRMGKPVTAGSDSSQIHKARLLRSTRITPESSREEVRQLVFHTDDPDFDAKAGSSIRILAPGEYGNRYHPRIYSLVEHEHTPDGIQFALCVRRCFFIDDVNGEQYQGIASNYLCDLKPGDEVEFSGPTGYPFPIPENTNSNLLMIGMGTGIAPFRALVRTIYEKHGGWKGKVRLFHGARTGLELLYLNDANNDLASYFDQPTFKAFQAVSPRPAFDAPIALDKSIEQNAAEVWEMVNSPDCRVYIAGMTPMLGMIDKAMTNIAGSVQTWQAKRNELTATGRWVEILY